MTDTIKALLNLSKIDSYRAHLKQGRDDLQVQKSQIQLEITEQQAQALQKEQSWHKLKSEFEGLKDTLLTKESDLKGKEERVSSIKTQKEYLASQKEISVLKKEIMDLKAQTDILSQNVGNEELQYQEFKTLSENNLQKLNQRLLDIEERFIALDEAHRDDDKTYSELISQFPFPEVLKTYQKILERTVPALSQAEGNVCGECSTRLLPQTLLLLQRGQGLHHCGRCKRILYI